MNIRHIMLDTETTGINLNGFPYQGHRIIEIGAVEMIDRRFTNNNFHVYLNPDRLIDVNAFKIHGISNAFLKDKPRFSEIANKFFEYIKGAELVIHNAAFDVSFIDHEFSKLNTNFPKIKNFCKIIDTLMIARKMFPGKRNSLDALCARYAIDNRKRILHGALLDAQILADIFILMTRSQNSLSFLERKTLKNKKNYDVKNLNLILKKANKKEIFEHEKYLNFIKNKNGICLWKNS